MNGTELLRRQHREIEALFERIAEASAEDWEWVLGQLSTRLRAHSRLEEELFYPRCRAIDSLSGLVLECLDEHDEAIELLGTIERMDTSTGGFLDRIAQLEDLVIEHVDMEENQVMPRVEARIPAASLEAMGEELRRRHGEILAGEGTVAHP